ncbi:MAG: DUF1499 domain-containing protein [Desulfobulbaceae bacterium]|nr:DUF1499 domain-containing protein [Desulfobulbaceae bacterium]
MGVLMVDHTDVRAGSDLILSLCPSSPNCISSQAVDSHFIEPFTQIGEARAGFDNSKAILGLRKDTIIVSATEIMIGVEFKTTLGFVDDGLFLLDGVNKMIHIRSASRVGYWDLGKNRRRMEEIRQDYQNLAGI